MNQPVEHFALTAPGDPRLDTTRHITAPRGLKLTCKNWLIEAAYRMIQNNLDPEVAERPEALVVYGGIGRAARDWPRSSGFRIGCITQSRDGGDEGSLGRRVGLAIVECDVKYGRRGDMGIYSPWRWRGYGLLSARGRGDCV